jgi:hypothetical protein
MYPTPGPITTAAAITLTREENLVVQNLSTSPLFVRLGPGATTSAFHHALAAGGANDDGTGGSIEIDGRTFTGAVTFASAAVRYSAYKYTRRN